MSESRRELTVSDVGDEDGETAHSVTANRCHDSPLLLTFKLITKVSRTKVSYAKSSASIKSRSCHAKNKQKRDEKTRFNYSTLVFVLPRDEMQVTNDFLLLSRSFTSTPYRFASRKFHKKKLQNENN